MQLLDSKSLLAKLMATENLIVEQRKVDTAMFDVKSRVLVIPQLDKNISGYLYDLFVGHEVGHALYTPLDGLMKAREQKISQAVTNVVEDSRIERKIKNKYPGLRNSFVKAYKELLQKDFFGTQGVDLNTLPFLDRLNLFCKGGPAQGIDFSPFEKSLVQMVESTETYDDVIRVSKLVADYSKEEKEAKRQQMLEEGVMDENDEYDTYEEDSEDGEFDYNEDFDGESGDGEEEDEEDGDTSGEDTDEESEDETKDDKSPSGTSGGQMGDNDETEIRSLTDENFKKNESKLYAKDEGSYYYGNVPDVDLDRAVLDYKKVFAQYKSDTKHIELRTKNFQKFRKETSKVVSYMVKEFELRKNADQMKRASVAKTGELDMNRIFSYKFNDDIFKKITVVPGGKSHGLVMFLDWSGSMSGHLEHTMKQLITLVMFCKKVNIPFEVFAFTSESPDNYHQSNMKNGDIMMKPFHLLNIFSSRMSAVEFNYAANVMVEVSCARYSYCRLFAMGGTPLNEAVISAMKIVPEFQKKYKLQVVNTVFLTDGEGHRLNSVYAPSDDYSWGRSRTFIARDPITKHQEIVEDYSNTKNTAAYIKLLKARTNCNILGFYVLSGREFSRAAYILLPKAADVEAMRAKFRKEKSLVITNAGFDEYYMLRSEALDVDEDTELVVKENATTRGLVSAFSKYTKNRLNNRVVLNRFIGMIA